MSNPMDSLNYFRLSGLFCDIKLWAKKPNGPLYQMQGGPYQAHRVIISASSPVLCRTLTTGEGKDKDNISIPVRDPGALEIVLLWIYGQVSEVLERIQRRPQVVEIASDLANSLEVDSLVEYLRQCGGNQFEEDFFEGAESSSSSGIQLQSMQPQQTYQSGSRLQPDSGDANSVQWDKSWDQNLEMATVGSGASNDSMALTAFSKLPTPPGRSIPLSIPTTPPFLAKITSIGKTVRVLCKECGEDKSIVYKTKFTLKAHLKNAHNVSIDFFDDRHEVLVYDRAEYDAEAKDIVDRSLEKRKLVDKIESGEIKSKALDTIGKDVKVLCPECPLKIDSVIFKSKTTLKIHMLHHHNKTINLKDEEYAVPVVDEDEWLREYEVAKLRVADAADRVRRLEEIMAKLEDDPMLLVPEEVDTDDEEEQGELKKETNGVAEGGEDGEKKKEGESEEKEGKEEAKKEMKTSSSSSAETKKKPDGTLAVKPKRVYEKQPLLIPFDLVHGNSVRVFCAICRREYLNRYLLKAHFKVSHPEWFEEIEAKPCTGILVVDLDEYKRAAQKEIDSGGASMHFKPKQMAKIEISKKLGISPPPPLKTYPCTICSRTFSHSRVLKRHMKRAHPWDPKSLSIASGDADSASLMGLLPKFSAGGVRPPRHPDRINPKQDASVRTCRICNQEFADRIYYRKHMKVKHKMLPGSHGGEYPAFRRLPTPQETAVHRRQLSLPTPSASGSASSSALGTVRTLMDDSLGSAEFSTDDSGDTDFNVTMSAVNEEAEEGEEGHDPYEDSHIEFEDSSMDADDTVEEQEEEEEDENGFEEETLPSGEEAEAGDQVALVPLMVVPWATVPKNGIRPFCHFEECKQKMSSKNNLSIHLANSHENYIIDESAYMTHIEDNDLNKELLKRYADNRKHEEERLKWNAFLASHDSLITVQEVCTYFVHNKVLEPTDPILSKYPMVPFRFITPLFKKIACPLCGAAVNLKYYLHKHILSTHSIDVELDEIKMKRDRKNKSAVFNKSHNSRQILEAIKRKEKIETTRAYRASQKAKQQRSRRPLSIMPGSDQDGAAAFSSDDYGSLDADWSIDNGQSTNGDSGHHDDEDIYVEGDDNNYVMIDDAGDEDYTGKTTTTPTKSSYKRPTGVGSRGPYKKKKHHIPVPDDLTAVPFEDVRPYNLKVVCHVCYRVICNKTYLRQHLIQRHSYDVSTFETMPILLFKDDAKHLVSKANIMRDVWEQT